MNQYTPLVPTELRPLMDEAAQEIAAQWRSAPLTETQTIGDALTYARRTVELADDRRAVVGVLEPSYERDGTDVVLALPHQQALKPAMMVRAMVLQQVVAPDSRVIILPNNGGPRSDVYGFTHEERRRLHNGDLRPHTEQQVRILERLKASRVRITGYSLGGLTAVGMAAVGSPNIEVMNVNADEMPSRPYRTPRQLQKDFMRSGGLRAQLDAIADARIPVLEWNIYPPSRLVADYARFGLATLNPDNRALHAAMAGDAESLVQIARQCYPDMAIKLGHVAGSWLFENSRSFAGAVVRTYTGQATHGHTTGDNPFAHALMAKDGFNLPTHR